MTPQVGVAISSLVGAILFTAVGYLVARLRAAPAGRSAPEPFPQPGPDVGATAALEAQLGEARSAAESARGDLSRARADLEQAREAERQLRDELAAARAAAPPTVPPPNPLQQEQLLDLRRQLDNLREALAGKDLELAQANKRAADYQAQLAAVAKDRDRVNHQLQRAEQELQRAREVDDDEPTLVQKDASTLVQKDAPEAAARLHVMSREIERLQQENRELKAQVAKLGQQDAGRGEAESYKELLAARTRELEQTSAANETLRQRVATLERQLQQAQAGGKGALAEAQSQVQATASQLKKTRGALKQAQDALSKARLQAQQLKREAQGKAELEKQLAERDARLAAADNRLGQLPQLEEERFALKQQVQELEAKIAELSALESVADEKHQMAMQIEALKQRGQEAESLREERARLAAQLEEAQAELGHRAEQVARLEASEAARKDLAIKTDVLSEQLKELDRLREENLQLKSRASQLDDLKQQLEQMKAELASLRSLKLVKGQQPPAATSAPAAVLKGAGIGGSLQAILDGVGALPGSRGAALADEMGLLVAGAGEHTEPLAAVSAIFAEIAAKVTGALPLGRLQQLSLVDEHALTFSAQPFVIDTGQLILATLTAGPGPDKQTVSGLVAKISSTLA